MTDKEWEEELRKEIMELLERIPADAREEVEIFKRLKRNEECLVLIRKLELCNREEKRAKGVGA